MTEAEWLACTEPIRMIQSLQNRISARRLRLWACAYCRWHAPHVGMLLRAVEVAERWADGEEPPSQNELAGSLVLDKHAWRAAERISRDMTSGTESVAYQLESLRCVAGNPFRPITFSPSWRTDTALALARQMYESREFSPMPILADALQDAGCDNDDILSHCRDANQVHVRGCWVVDLVLGKT